MLLLTGVISACVVTEVDTGLADCDMVTDTSPVDVAVTVVGVEVAVTPSPLSDEVVTAPSP